METVVKLLADAFVERGIKVTVVTDTSSAEPDRFGFEVVRRPSTLQIWRAWALNDFVIQHGPSLRLGWPALLLKRPSAIVHHITTSESSCLPGASSVLRRALLGHSPNFAVSKFLSRSIPVRCEVIPNPFNDAVFRMEPGGNRSRDLIFVGRLVTEKGGEVLLQALKMLKDQGVNRALTMVGGGPLRAKLESMASNFGLDVRFTGVLRGPELASVLREHEIFVAPSISEEAFSIACLEAAACGCAVLGSQIGGLPEAIGPCGSTFRAADPIALAAAIEKLLRAPEKMEGFRRMAAAHLFRHRPDRVANQYLQALGLMRSNLCVL
jgi:glycosyltransferase involved in cell wall biosynthesis